MQETPNEIIATGDLRPERIQEPAALQAETGAPAPGIDPTAELRPERIQRGEAFQALVNGRNWMYLVDEETDAAKLVGYFDAPSPVEISSFARIVLEIAPEYGSRPELSMKSGAVSVTFGEDEPMTDMDIVFAHLFDTVLPRAESIFHQRA